jgi:hypothetical protein
MARDPLRADGRLEHRCAEASDRPQGDREANERGAGGYGGPFDWLGLWATGVYDLGLSSGQFWDLTPAQFDALLNRREAEWKASWHPANYWGSHALAWMMNSALHRQAVKPDDLIPKFDKPAQPVRRMSSAALKHIAEIYNIAIGGQIGGVRTSDPDRLRLQLVVSR